MRRFPARGVWMGVGTLALCVAASAYGQASSSSSTAPAATHSLPQLPAGTRSVDDTTRSDEAALQIREAEQDLEQKNYPAAEQRLQQLAASRPLDAQVQYDLGFAQERNGHEAAAAKSYAAAIAADQKLAEAHVALGLLEARTGHSDAAHEQLQAAVGVSVSPPDVRARALRALASLDETSDPAAARRELVEALKLSPETPVDTLMAAELAEEAGDATAAETAYRKVLSEVPDEPNATAGLGHVLQQQNRLPEAESVLTTTLKTHPNDPRLLAQLASVDVALHKPEVAADLLEQARTADPALAADLGLTRLLARLKTVSGDDAGAEALYEKLVEASPNDPQLLDALGSAQVRLGKYAAAEASLKRAVASREAFHDDQAWGEAEGHLAFACSKNEDPTGTLQALDQRATVLPNSAITLFLEATAHDTLHQTQEAIRVYKAFLAAAGGKYPDQEFEARHRLVALQHSR